MRFEGTRRRAPATQMCVKPIQCAMMSCLEPLALSMRPKPHLNHPSSSFSTSRFQNPLNFSTFLQFSTLFQPPFRAPISSIPDLVTLFFLSMASQPTSSTQKAKAASFQKVDITASFSNKLALSSSNQPRWSIISTTSRPPVIPKINLVFPIVLLSETGLSSVLRSSVSTNSP